MSQTPAGKLQDHIKDRVQKSGGQYRKARWEGRRGCPDCFVWWPHGAFAWIEVKAPGDRFSTLQEREGRRMQEAGLPVFVVTSKEEIDVVIPKVRGAGF